ncbi:energy transducer TonB [Curvibacter sp. CHRR-16]|uniref:energy transducer TonB n=1 Tax=Curvibacter sp. CHRR-16 TaxID=2835872 RepID=UPI001BDA51F9|nr:energy transducer TonB [Curvibacter sp. CHRR-16]MBT0571159.1 energy transducer TonB [Curvibacter sp. CHRR-16]
MNTTTLSNHNTRNSLSIGAVVALHAALLGAVAYLSTQPDDIQEPLLLQAILEDTSPSVPMPPTPTKEPRIDNQKPVSPVKPILTPAPQPRPPEPQVAPVAEAKLVEAVPAPTPTPAVASSSKTMDNSQQTAESSKANTGHAPPASAPKMVQPTTDADFLCAAPQYPAPSKRFKETGRVVINLLIDPTGKAAQASIKTSSGYPRLDQAALSAALKCRFKPGTRNGVPEAMSYEWPFTFVLND